MKIDLTSIIKNHGGTIEISMKEDLSDLKAGIGTISFTSPVEFYGTVTNFNGMLILKGDAKVDYSTVCDRCSKKIEKSLAVKIDEDIVEESRLDNSEEDSKDDRFTFSGNVLDLDRILVDCIVPNLPMSHICQDDCQGLCSSCGAKLNNDSCDCGNNDQIDPRFDVLKGFFD